MRTNLVQNQYNLLVGILSQNGLLNFWASAPQRISSIQDLQDHIGGSHYLLEFSVIGATGGIFVVDSQ